MKIKEAKICSALSWSPTATSPGLLALGSVAGAMGDDFNTSAHLEIVAVDVADTSTTNMARRGRVEMTDRVHRIDWGRTGGEHGLIAAGLVDGAVHVYSADKILEGGADTDIEEDAAIVCKITEHTAAVKGIQFNPLQPELLATGGLDKELKIWSLADSSNPDPQPAAPKSTHASEITDVRWNLKYPHILGTSTAAGVVTVWDLKAKRTAVSFQGTGCVTATALAWHPDQATQIAVARDDGNPVIQLWDLRKAMSPTREIRGHTAGVLALSWCKEDPSILVSCGRDGRTLFCNPENGTSFGELPSQGNWVYDVQWSPIPAVLASASFDSEVNVFAVQDVSAASSSKNSNDTFGGQPETQKPNFTVAPKWLKAPCGASFGFGGRIAVPHGKSIKLSTLNRSDDIAKEEASFWAEKQSRPAGSPQRAEWLNELSLKEDGHLWSTLSALAEASRVKSREPLLAHLGLKPDDAEAAAKAVSDATSPYVLEEDKFAELVSRCVVAGKMDAAIDLCIKADRFDDAFAIAHFAGQEAHKKVQQAYFAKRSNLRFVRYLSAVASSTVDSLMSPSLGEDGSSNEPGPWEEALAMYGAFIHPSKFNEAAEKLGDYLDSTGNTSGAETCYACCGNVGKVADLWFREEPRGVDALRNVIHKVALLEETLNRPCQAAGYAKALGNYAEALAAHGEFNSAMTYAVRAAQMKEPLGQIVADRVQYSTSGGANQRVPSPFQASQLKCPDAVTPACVQLASQQPAIRPQQQAQPQQAPQQFGGQQQQFGGQPQPAQGQAPQGQAPQQFQQPSQSAPRQPSQQPHGYPPQGQPPQGQPQQYQQPPQQPPQQQPPQQPPQAAPSQYPPMGQPGAPQQQQHGYANPQPSAPQPSAPQPSAPPPSFNRPPAAHQDPSAQPPVNAGSNPFPPPAAPMPSAPPSAAPSNGPPPSGPPPAFQPNEPPRMPTASPPTASPPATSPPPAAAQGLSNVDTSAVSDSNRPIVNSLTTAVQRVSDNRKRINIEKSLEQLFARLNASALNEDACKLLLEFSAAVEAGQKGAAKDVWNKLTEAQWDAVQPFIQIKFLI